MHKAVVFTLAPRQPKCPPVREKLNRLCAGLCVLHRPEALPQDKGVPELGGIFTADKSESIPKDCPPAHSPLAGEAHI